MAPVDYERLPMYSFSSSSNTTRHRSSSQASSKTSSSISSIKSFSQRSSNSSFPRLSRTSRWARGKRSPSTSSHHYFRPRSRLTTALLFAVATVVLLLLLGLYWYEPHIELAFYDRNWVTTEIQAVPRLSGCFHEHRVSPKYNLTEGLYGRRRTEIQAGMPLRMGLDCYDFSGTIQSDPDQRAVSRGPIPPEEKTQYHTYWRVDLAPFGPRQEWMLKSYFTSQDLATTRLVLWSNGDLRSNPILQSYLRRFPHSFALKVVDIPALARGTELEGSPLLAQEDSKAWVDGDLVRLLLLWNFGGVWIDMDSLLTRDLDPLLEHEFVTQWDCYDKKYTPFNGALMRFRQHSPYLCEAFHIMAHSAPPRPGSTDWGSLLYFKLWRGLVAASLPPFRVLPFCFTDGRSCRLDNRLPDPFVKDRYNGKWTFGLGLEEGGGLDKVLSKVFGVHLHNQWEKEFPEDGWVQRLLLRRYDQKLETL